MNAYSSDKRIRIANLNGAKTTSEKAARDENGIRLIAAENGLLRLDCGDGSMGRLILPRRIAIDGARRVYRVMGDRIARYEYAEKDFRVLPTIGGVGDAPRQFRFVTNIAADRDNLYVADTGNKRVQVFALPSLALRAIWAVPSVPRDVAVYHGTVYVLTEADEVLRYRMGDGAPCFLFENDDRNPAKLKKNATDPKVAVWRRIGIDRDGRIYLLRLESKARLDIYLPDGTRESDPKDPRYQDAANFRSRFEIPKVMTRHNKPGADKFKYILSPELLEDCVIPCGPPPTEQQPVETRLRSVFASSGRYPSTPLFQRDGFWISEPLDSEIFHCQWHRIDLSLSDLPPGCVVRVRSYSSDISIGNDQVKTLPDSAWDEVVAVNGQLPDPKAKDSRVEFDGLIQGGPGRYLWLRVDMLGDGFATPFVRGLTVHFPRQSLLQYLPANFSEDEQSRRFLERFLAIFQYEWDKLEDRVADFAMYLDPNAAPENGGYLEYLAEWMGVRFENEWNPEQRRRLLANIPHLTYAPRSCESEEPGCNRRGTLSGLAEFLRVSLDIIRKAPAAESSQQSAPAFPFVIEGYRERELLLLAKESGERRGPPQSLWGSDVVNRLRLDEHALLDESRLLSEGDPELDAFRHYAHRFRVLVPAAWIQDAASESAFRRAIVAEKPAHADFDLNLVAPRFRVATQSTCGIDTIVGDIPRTILPGAGAADDVAPSAPPTCRLGFDTVLVGRDDDDSIRLIPAVRLGAEALRL